MGLFDFTKKIFGSKYDKDLKQITPVIDKIKEAYPHIQKLSNDELRGKTTEFKSKIKSACQANEQKIVELNNKAKKQDLNSHFRNLNITKFQAVLFQQTLQNQKYFYLTYELYFHQTC